MEIKLKLDLPKYRVAGEPQANSADGVRVPALGAPVSSKVSLQNCVCAKPLVEKRQSRAKKTKVKFFFIKIDFRLNLA